MSTGTDYNDFLLGGSKTPSAKFPTKGTVVEGVICDEPQMRQQTSFGDNEPIFWDEAKTQPRQMLVIRIQTEERDADDPDDEGVRGLFIKSKQQREALAKAVKEAGMTGLQVGAKISACYTGDGPKPDKGFAQKLYAYKVEKPTGDAAAFLGAASTTDDSATPPW